MGLTPDGWTQFVESVDTRKVYVSATGNDSNNGLSEGAPKLTISAGIGVLRDNKPDWLLLKAGDSWSTSVSWNKSGLNADEPMLMSSYGAGARPQIDSEASHGITLAADVHFVAFVGIKVFSSTFTGSQATRNGIQINTFPISNILLEDMHIENYVSCLLIQTGERRPPLPFKITDIKLRRCIIARAYNTRGTISTSLFVKGVDTILFEENLFHMCGQDSDVAGSTDSVFNHGVYFQHETRNITVKGNLWLYGASDCTHRGSIGTWDNNYWWQFPMGLEFGGGTDQSRTPDGATSGDVINNVWQNGRDRIGGDRKGKAFTCDHISSGSFRNNILDTCFQDGSDFSSPPTFHPWQMGTGNPGSVGLNDWLVDGNIIHEWDGDLLFSGVGIDKLTFSNNDYQQVTNPNGRTNSAWIMEIASGLDLAEFSSNDNRFHSVIPPASKDFEVGGSKGNLAHYKAETGDSTSTLKRVSYTDPGRTPQLYVDHVEGLTPGTSTWQDWLDKLYAQRKGSYNQNYKAEALNDWIRAGFNITDTQPMPACTILIAAIDTLPSSLRLGEASSVRDEPFVWGTKQGLPNWVHMNVTDAPRTDFDFVTDNWLTKYTFEPQSGGPPGTTRYVIKVHPDFVANSGAGAALVEDAIEIWVEETHNGEKVNASPTTFLAQFPSLGLPDVDELIDEFNDIFEGRFNRKLWFMNASDVAVIVALGGDQFLTKVEALALWNDKRND